MSTQSLTLVKMVEKVRATWPKMDLTDRRVLLNNLTYMYRCMVASEDLLRDAVEHTHYGDRLEYYITHALEEHNHAQWLARDLSTAGVQVDALETRCDVAAMVGAQYYLIRYVNACALLGYMAVLECWPMSMKALEALEVTHGTELLRTVRHHTIEDPEHRDDLLEQIDRLTPEEFAIVLDNALQCAYCIKASCERMLTDGLTPSLDHTQE